jgi:hypothetical protein
MVYLPAGMPLKRYAPRSSVFAVKAAVNAGLLPLLSVMSAWGTTAPDGSVTMMDRFAVVDCA